MDVNELIDNLRLPSWHDLEDPDATLLADAADALSTLLAENKKLRAELEQVKQDRDSVEQDFRAFAKQWWEEDSGFPCRWCKFENSGGCEWKVKQPNEEKICAGRAFEWRSPQKED